MAFSEEEEAYGFVNFDKEFLVEEWQGGGKMRFLVDYEDEDVDLLANDDDQVLVDLNLSLPRDPFGMGFNIEATVAAITGWMEDVGLKVKASGFESDNEDINGNEVVNHTFNDDDPKTFAIINFVWTRSYKGKKVEDPMMYYVDDGMDDLMCFGCEIYGGDPDDRHGDGRSAAAVDAIVFVLEYLKIVAVKDLLCIERVCKSLRDAIKKDPYLWTSIHIDQPSSKNISDEELVQLTDRAQGKLQCLSLELVKSSKISQDGLKQVLERNLELTKLSVVGSSNMSSEGILENLKLFNCVGRHGIKYLRIGDAVGLKNEHFEEYKLVLGIEENENGCKYKPRFYRIGEINLSLDDERCIDIEICPRCEKVGQVFDCPTPNCSWCRACISCTPRCIRCGCCLFNKAYEETFCFDCLCIDCLKELFLLDAFTVPPGQLYWHEMARIHFFFYS